MRTTGKRGPHSLGEAQALECMVLWCCAKGRRQSRPVSAVTPEHALQRMQRSGRAGRPGPKELSRDSRRLDRGLCKRRDGALIISLAAFPQRRATGGSRGAVVNTKSRLLCQKSFCKARAAQQQPRAARGTTTRATSARRDAPFEHTQDPRHVQVAARRNGCGRNSCRHSIRSCARM